MLFVTITTNIQHRYSISIEEPKDCQVLFSDVPLTSHLYPGAQRKPSMEHLPPISSMWWSQCSEQLGKFWCVSNNMTSLSFSNRKCFFYTVTPQITIGVSQGWHDMTPHSSGIVKSSWVLRHFWWAKDTQSQKDSYCRIISKNATEQWQPWMPCLKVEYITPNHSRSSTLGKRYVCSWDMTKEAAYQSIWYLNCTGTACQPLEISNNLMICWGIPANASWMAWLAQCSTLGSLSRVYLGLTPAVMEKNPRM